jgi:hypothetical protein
VLLQLLALDLGVDQDGGEVIGWPLPTFRNQLATALEDLRENLGGDPLDAVRVQVLIARAQGRVHEGGPHDVVLGRNAHEAADHPRDHRLGHVGHQVAGVAPVQAIQDVADDLPDGRLVRSDPLGCEASLEEHLEPVVLGRVHSDEHGLQQLQWEPFGDRGDPASLR